MLTRKQAGVIFRAVKENKIEMTEEQINKMYKETEKENRYNLPESTIADRLQVAVMSIFDEDYENAQEQIRMAFDLPKGNEEEKIKELEKEVEELETKYEEARARKDWDEADQLEIRIDSKNQQIYRLEEKKQRA